MLKTMTFKFLTCHFLFLKVFINSSREKYLIPFLKFYDTILIVFSFTSTVSIDNKLTIDNCQRHKSKKAVGIKPLMSICCRRFSSGLNERCEVI